MFSLALATMFSCCASLKIGAELALPLLYIIRGQSKVGCLAGTDGNETSVTMEAKRLRLAAM